MAIRRHPYSQSMLLKQFGSDSNGVCLTLCRRLVKKQLTGAWQENSTIYDISDPDEVGQILETQAKQGKLKDVGVEGLLDSVSNKRTGGGALKKFEGLRTRQDVIDHVWNVPGVYIYAATAEKSGGHAFNFDTRNTKTRSFFDPNQGEWVFEDESLVSVRNWWKEFWEAKGAGDINYKTAFHKGVRELIKFEVPPTA